MTSSSFKLQEGHEFHQQDGLLHSHADRPAVVYADGTQWWYREGQVHRDNGPAVVHANGVEEWWQENKRHRTDGPAVTYPTTLVITPALRGVKQWWLDGKLQREELPGPVQRYRVMVEQVYRSCFGDKP